IFGLLSRTGGLSEAEMLRTFNCGLGLVLVVPDDEASAVAAELEGHVVGQVTERPGLELV
ncbi:MAG TPA: phosphoribosylformylglycinamidine cyclo-ligase, partial [Deltaproteobacteria bacterium]|nr:phosphoribosylformylglycinamidine cyclo-ligase [Deltaproteobacteria bacterium]